MALLEVSHLKKYFQVSSGILHAVDDVSFLSLIHILLVRFGVGFDKVNLPDASAHGLAVARTTGANKTGVAEMALMMMLAAGRQVMLNRKTVASGVWEKNIGHELIGKKVGILGFGNIGMALAKLLQGFDCEVLAYDTYRNEAAASDLNVRFADLNEILTTCDAISVHLLSLIHI